MKEVSITIIPIGTRFTYKDMEFEVVDRSEYPFIEAKCLEKNNPYEHHLLFTNFEHVIVADGAKTYKQSFVETGRHYYAMKEELG